MRLDGEAAQRAATWALANGWKLMVCECARGIDSGSATAGVAIAVRDGFGLGFPSIGSCNDPNGRYMLAQFEAPGWPPLILVSAYFWVGEGLTARNVAIMEAVGRHLTALQQPFIWGADWNLSPDTLSGTELPTLLGAEIAADMGPAGTCITHNSVSTIDFFLVSSGIADAAQRIVAWDGPIKTHRPVDLCLRTDAPSLVKIVPLRVTPIPPRRVIGPLMHWKWTIQQGAALRALDFAKSSSDIRAIRGALSFAYRRFAEQAEEELAHAAGVELPCKRVARGRPVKYITVPLIDSSAGICGCSPSAAWRWLHRRGKELMFCLQMNRWDTYERLVQASIPTWMANLANDPADFAWSVTVAHRQMTDNAGTVYEALRATQPARNPLQAELHDPFAEDGEDPIPDIVREAMEELELHVDALDERAKVLEARDHDSRRTSWKAWVEAALVGGASQGHRFAKGPQPWIPKSTNITGAYSISPENLLLAEHDRCSGLWSLPQRRCTRSVQHELHDWQVPPAERSALPRLSPAELRRAGLSCPEGKAVSFDGFHLRHFGMLSDGALVTVGILWEACEWAVELPEQLDHQSAPLIPKKGQGYRDLVLFAGMIRCCTKARANYCIRWEEQNDRDYFACGRRRSAPDVVWRAAVKAEAATQSQLHAAAVLWDMSSFFQMIRHQPLLSRSRAANFPIEIARMAVRLYRSPRRLRLGALSSDVSLAPNRGVAPGCHWATTIVKVYCLQPFDGFVKLHPKIELDVYIDDIQLALAGYKSREALALQMVDAADAMLQVVHVHIQADLAEHKAAVVASDSRLFSMLRRRLGVLAGIGTKNVAATALGIDYAAGRARQSMGFGSQKSRFAKVAARRHRLRALAKAGGALATKVARCGCKPAALYGAEVVGVPCSLLLSLRRTMAASTIPRAQGRSLDVTLALSGLEVTKEATAAPICRWAREVWQASLITADRRGGLHRPASRAITIRKLVQLWDRARVDEVGRWGNVRGPLGAAKMSMERIGWQWTHPHTVVTDAGIILNFAQDSPALVQHHVHLSVARKIERRIAVNTKDPELSGKRVDLDILSAHLRSRAKGALTVREKIVLKCVAADSFWPGKRLAEAGLIENPLCVMCGSGQEDTIFHRAWECQHPDVLEARRQHADENLIQEALAAGPSSALFTRALSEHPCHRMPEVGTQQLRFTRSAQEVADEKEWQLCGNLYYDGSCFRAHSTELSRAAFSVVQMEGQTVIAKLQGTVPANLPQTSQAAEQCGRAAAVQLLNGPSTLIGDCKSVVDTARASHLHALHHSRIHAGARLLAVTSGKYGFVQEDRWVKAHREISAAANDQDEMDIIGNQAADLNAVLAQQLHTWPEANFRNDIDREQQRLRRVIKVLVSTVVLWPSQATQKEDGASRAIPCRRPAQPARRPHLWEYRGRAWYCRSCLTIARTDDTKAKRYREECAGCSASIATVLSNPQGHLIVAADDNTGAPVIACVRCGAWATRHPRKLMQPCPKFCRFPSAAHYAMQRLSRLRHPDHTVDRTICEPVVVGEDVEKVATQVLDKFLQEHRGTRRTRQNYVKVPPVTDLPQNLASSERIEAMRMRVMSRL